MPRGVRKTTAIGDARLAAGREIGKTLATFTQAADRALVLEVAYEVVTAVEKLRATVQPKARKARAMPKPVVPVAKTTPKTPDRQARAIGAVAGEDGED